MWNIDPCKRGTKNKKDEKVAQNLEVVVRAGKKGPKDDSSTQTTGGGEKKVFVGGGGGRKI